MIQNKPRKYIGDPVTDRIRSDMEHRAAWFYFLLEEMKNNGIDVENARNAIFKCGCLYGKTKYPKTDDLKEFYHAFIPEDIAKVLEVEAKVTDNEVEINFGYCPLVAAWQKLTDDEEYIAKMCDIAMEGDRGIFSKYPQFEFVLGDKIAEGCPTCNIKLFKNKK